MSKLTNITSERTHLTKELACYLQTDILDIVLPTLSTVETTYNAQSYAQQYSYGLPLGTLQLLELILYLPSSISRTDIETVRIAAIKSALNWQKGCLSKDKNNKSDFYYAFILDIQLNNDANAIGNINHNSGQNGSLQRLTHHFSARYFTEDLILDTSDSIQQLQIFSWHDWYLILLTVQTPCELWRFLEYHLTHLGHHLTHLEQIATSNLPSFDSDQALLAQFMNSNVLFTPAIVVDDALIKYGIQDKPNSALVTMKLAQKNKSVTAQMYRQHMQQAAELWSQLSTQMLDLFSEKLIKSEKKQPLAPQYFYWQQQLLDESLFSRHELVRTLYRHPKQAETLQQSGYVVHQHSYENLGRHYVLIFYGQEAGGPHSKVAIQPNLQQIAQDVATRLPIAELHHVIVLGIEFITDAVDTFMDIDLWIQPVGAMTQKERQLTQQLQGLKQQKASRANLVSTALNQKNNKLLGLDELPRLYLNLSIPARNNKP